MARRRIDLTGTSGKTYDFDEIVGDYRLNEGKRLRIQVYEYSEGENKDPSDIQTGSLWMSVKKENKQ